jgi:hypothetical protein
MARGYIDIYQDNYTTLVETGYWGLHMEGQE